MKALILLLAICHFVATAALADGGPTARAAVQALGRDRGKAAADHVVYLSGSRGMDQPLGWRLITRDPKTGVFVEHWAQGNRIVSSKSAPALAGQAIPARRWVLDSSAAFSIAERAANKNRIGFDSVDYELRCLELSDRPVWFLTMWNHSGAKSGEVTVAADNGAILRKIWFPAGRVIPQKRPAGPAVAQTAPPPQSAPASRSTADVVKESVSQTTSKVSGFFGRLFGTNTESDYVYSQNPPR